MSRYIFCAQWFRTTTYFEVAVSSYIRSFVHLAVHRLMLVLELKLQVQHYVVFI